MDQRLFFPATQRNFDPIAKVFANILPEMGSILEIASGSGEHGVRFQERFPKINWQTSDPNPFYRESINAWITYKGLTSKMAQPLNLDVEARPWPIPFQVRETIQAIVCINMTHITPWSATKALLAEASELLHKDQFLMLYGPFQKDGQHTSYSNEQFDQSLKLNNRSWGIRDLTEISLEAIKHRFQIREVIPMPANNFSVLLYLK